jgi:7-carboxy-7-deazaguanine synthase
MLNVTKLVVNEIFHSIQGESAYMGLPCVFVRLTYCNLRCRYCDTEYAFYDGKEMTIAETIEAVRSHQCRLVEITGGEPLLQDGVYELVTRLCDDGYEVLLETGGSLDISRVDPRASRIVDLKCPSSNMEHRNYWKNIDYLTPKDEVKFVVGTREDYDWAKEIIGKYSLYEKCPLLMSVVFADLEPAQLAEWILQDRLSVRFQLQMHKYIWTPETRGV